MSLSEVSSLYAEIPPEKALGIPLAEVDPSVEEDTFCVACMKFGQAYIYRYTREKTIFGLFGPYSTIRRLSIAVTTHVAFEICLILVVVMNCICLAVPELVPYGFENVFTVFYCAEIMLQTIGRGLAIGTYSYLRNPWQCLDFIITMISLSMLTVSQFVPGIEKIPEIKALRGLRALKAITRIPGVQTMAQGMLLSVSRMGGVFIIMFLFLTTMTLLAKQLYMGVLLQKCVIIPPSNLSAYNETYHSFINNEENWQLNEDDEPVICGNGSGALGCDKGFICLPNVGINPDHGYSNFDNFGWSFLNTFRILTQDAWEDLYNMIIQATGPISILFFIPIIFFGSFYLLNLMIAVVDSAYSAAMAESNEAKRVLSNYQNSSCFQFDLRRLHLFPLPTNEGTLRDVLAKRDRLLEQKISISRGWKVLKEVLKSGGIERLRHTVPGRVVEHEAEEQRTKENVLSGPWNNFRAKLRRFSDSNGFRRFIFVCIVVNTVLLASEHYGMSSVFREAMLHANQVLTTCFLIEEIIDITAYGKEYFYDWWNVMDFFIVMESVISLLLESLAELSFARSLRLLRLMKLSHTWSTLRKVITVILDSLGNIIRLLVVVAVMIFVFSVMGVRLLGQNYSKQVFFPDPMPRWSFATFGGSLFTVFQIITGEWVEPLWDCMRAENVHLKCPLIIGAYFLIGNFVILNLFIALLLSSFDSADLQFSSTNGDKPIGAVFEKFFDKYLSFCKKKQKTIEVKEITSTANDTGDVENGNKEEDVEDKVNPNLKKNYSPCKAWIEKLAHSTMFECVITVLIFGSCISLSFEDANLPKHPIRRKIISTLNYFFTGAFTVEMLLKWIGLGIKNYFRDGWARFDFVIVTISLVEAAVSVSHQGKSRLSALKALRALRPLRFIPRWKGMQMVVTALVMSLPAIFRVILVCMFIWLTFAILGVHLFAGRLFRCVDDQDKMVSPDIVDNKFECLARNLTWANPFINFDHIGNSYLALFQVALFTGWIEIIEMVVDVRPEPNLQPRPNASPWNYLFIIGFILVGGFLTLNLFVGVVVDTFKDMKKHVESGGVIELLLTDSQRRYYTAMMKLRKKKPARIIRQPRIPLLYFFYRVTYNEWFQMVIMAVICFNALTIAVESYQESPAISGVLRLLDFVFQGVYTVEFFIKFLGMRKYYFYDLWNIFDFVLWLSNSIGMTLETKFNQEMPIPLSVIYAFRLLRILRLLHLIKSASDIRRLIFSLLASAPALFNICVLLFLLIFIYSIMGMSFFAFVKHNGVIDDNVNFATLGSSVLLLFRLTSAAGWEEVLHALSIQPPHCDQTYNEETNMEGNCGSQALAILFLLSFILLSNIILVNIFIAIILDSYEDAVAEESDVISDDDIDGFYEDWAKYDPNASQFIHLSLLPDFLDGLDESLSFPKPNNAAIAAMNLPVTEAELVHCLDVLQGIVKIKVGKVEETKEFRQICEKLNQNFLKIFPRLKTTHMAITTMMIRRQHFAASVIQRKLRRYRESKRNAPKPQDVSVADDIDLCLPNESLRLLAQYLFDSEPRYYYAS